MERKTKKIQDNDISVINNKNHLTFSSPNNLHTGEISIKPTFSDTQYEQNTVQFISAPENSDNDEQRQRRLNVRQGKGFQHMSQTPQFIKHTSGKQSQKGENKRIFPKLHIQSKPSITINGNMMFSNPSLSANGNKLKSSNNEALSNVGLTNSIPFTAAFPKSPENSLLGNSSLKDTRKFKIFSDNREIAFFIPQLEQYYANNNQLGMNISTRYDNAGSKSMSQPNNMLNASSYSFFNFRNQGKNNQDQKISKYQSIDSSMNINNNRSQNLNTFKSRDMNIKQSKSSYTIEKPVKLGHRNTTSQVFQDEIKQQTQEEEQSEKLIQSLSKSSHINTQAQNRDKKDYQVKGAFLLLGFLIATIIMIIFGNFK